MAADSVNPSSLSFSAKRYTVLTGAILILLTTTVPYLTLLNLFLFAGVFISGTLALNHSILRFQVRLAFSEAFLLGCFAGMVGGMLSEGAGYLLMEFFHYRPGAESLSLVIKWALDMARERPELHEQVQTLVAAEKMALSPVRLSFADLLMNMVFSGAIYAPIAGLGGSFAVLRLKRRATRS
ncbi:MAG: hypothetical protein WCH05_01310 [Chlorobiaceae bacterium]